MIFTIEPMINAGKAATKILADGWTAVTRDRSLSAQFEISYPHHQRWMRDLYSFTQRVALSSLSVNWGTGADYPCNERRHKRGSGISGSGGWNGVRTPHWHGHRQRLKERFLQAVRTDALETMAGNELLELVLLLAPRMDVKFWPRR